MQIDFYNEFRNSSTVQLLIITREPEKYQPAAIEAAERLLRERNISPTELDAANQQLVQEADDRLARSERMNAYKEQVADVLESVLIPNTSVNPAKWFRLFLVTYALLYARTLYNVVKTQMDFLHCKNCHGDFSMLGGPINAIFLTIVFYCLLKNRRWGWILLMFSNTIGVMAGLVMLPALYRIRYINLFPISPVSLIFSFGVPLLYVVFLWRPSIAEFFGVDVQTRRRTAWIGIGAGLFVCAFINYIL
jgi:hypothetical protein